MAALGLNDLSAFAPVIENSMKPGLSSRYFDLIGSSLLVLPALDIFDHLRVSLAHSQSGAPESMTRDSMCSANSSASHQVGLSLRTLKSFSAWSR